MIRLIGVLVFLGIVAAGSAPAATYTCRDEQGRLYVGDNLQALPEACRARVRTLPEQDPANLNFVPDTSRPAGPSHEFNRAVAREQEAFARKRSREQALQARSQRMTVEYRQAEEQKWAARRDLTTRSRELYDQAVRKQEQLRSEKKTILEQLSREKVSTDIESEVRNNLEQIGG